MSRVVIDQNLTKRMLVFLEADGVILMGRITGFKNADPMCAQMSDPYVVCFPDIRVLRSESPQFTLRQRDHVKSQHRQRFS